MRKLLVVLCILACAFAASAQIAPGSLENGLTVTLFENEIDQAFQPNADFGVFGKSFLFAGLGNPLSGDAAASAFTTRDAWDVSALSATSPLSFGVYSAKGLPVPLSIYSDMWFTAFANRRVRSNYTSQAFSTKTVVSGTVSTQSNWVNTSVQHRYTDPVIASIWNTSLQGLTKIGGVVVGLMYYMGENNSASDAAATPEYFQTTTTTYFVDDNALVANSAPAAVQNYTETVVQKNIDAAALPGAGGTGVNSYNNTIAFGIPLALRTGKIDHVINLGMVFDWDDASGRYSSVESLHSRTVGGAANIDDNLAITSKQTATTVAAGYKMSMPMKGTAGNALKVNVGASVDFEGASYSYDYTTRPYDLSALNTKTAVAGGTHVVQTDTYRNIVDFDIDLGLSRVFDYSINTLSFRFAPSYDCTLWTQTNGGASYQTSTVSYTQILDAAGAYNNANYVRTTVREGRAPASVFTMGNTVSVPMAMKVKPAGWLFGVMLGAEPSLTVNTAWSKAQGAGIRTTQTETLAGTSQVASATVNTASTGPSTLSTAFTYGLSEVHFIGVTLGLDGGARLDARINGNLLAFESFTVQAFLPF